MALVWRLPNGWQSWVITCSCTGVVLPSLRRAELQFPAQQEHTWLICRICLTC